MCGQGSSGLYFMGTALLGREESGQDCALTGAAHEKCRYQGVKCTLGKS